MKKIIYITLLILLAAPAFSQNTGFGGKRVLIKTDLLNGVRSPLFSASAELLITRRFTLTGGYRITSGKYNQIYFYDEYHSQDYYYYSDYSQNKLKDKADIDSRVWSIEARLYKGGVIPAPKGFFYYGTYTNGNVDVKGNYYESLTSKINTSSSSNKDNNLYYTYEAKNIKTWGLEGGLGYQSFINKYVTLGFKLGLNYTSFNYDNNWDPKVLSGVAKTYGPNLLRLAPLDLDDTDHPVASLLRSSGDSVYKGSVGLNFYLQLGILLF
ncbi:hypothetical protein MYP_3717 [Sporocytophaga myxococcoides]|uniref:Outer membrane protein beta-barrel domain-containing protein n=1 Tax=Sporocytophaga myxococcoides TaxID=153721 RepID=A0A098LJX4_9BACT|nr:hypothetical protein [Sporocytophaga myxococcoides]GAL86488.1 hypothetical protein MYP_3717 [Sporocytophaga myxococcoides]